MIEACEYGSLSKVEAALNKGAQADLLNEQGKHPIYAAAYGMNPKIVMHLTGLLQNDSTLINWQDCETHNTKYYGQLFFNMKFAPTTYKEWYDLLTQIEPNDFLSEHHLGQAEYAQTKRKILWSMNGLKEYAFCCGHPRPLRANLLKRPWAADEITIFSHPILKTELGYVVAKEQIKLQLKQMGLQKRSEPTEMTKMTPG